jgi:hypothetical protein
MLHGVICAKIGVPGKFGLDKVTNAGVDADLPASMQGLFFYIVYTSSAWMSK